MLSAPTPSSASPANHSSPPSLSARLKQRCKPAIVRALYSSGLLGLLRGVGGSYVANARPGSPLPRLQRFAGSKFGILCYHRVGTEGVPFFSRLRPDVFEAQMRYLKKTYRVVSLAQLSQELLEDRKVAPTLAITFDDGYRDLYTHAFPVLRKYEIPATIYLIGRCMENGEAPWYDRIFVAFAHTPDAVIELETDTRRQFDLSTPALRADAAWQVVCYLRSLPDGQRREWCAAFDRRLNPPAGPLQGRMLNWEEVRTMLRGGVFFGAHTMTHPAVSRLEPSAFDYEFVRSKEVLEAGLASQVEDFAFPFGRPADVSHSARQYLVSAGYRSAATTIEGFNGPRSDVHMLNRLQIDDHPSLSWFAFKVARLFLEATSPHNANSLPLPVRQDAVQVASRRSGL